MQRSEYPKFLALIVIAAAARALSLHWLHPVTWDEIEFYRATKWVAQGLVPFRDFWEHHTPLQWFVFAPVAAFVDSPGVAAIVALRWAQVPLWILTFAALMTWMRNAGLSLPARLGAVLLAICSSMFMLAVVEYRIDAVGCALFMLALLFLQKGGRWGFAAGAALCLAGFANIRLGPLLAATFVAGVVPASRRPSRAGVVIGAALASVICAGYFVATNSVAIAFNSVWTDNYVGDKLVQGPRWMFLHRLAVPFGVRPLETAGPLVAPGSIDVATIAILILGVVAMIRSLRTRDPLFELAILQIVNITFVALMKFVHHYHFEIVILLMLPFVASQLERMNGRAVTATLVIASAVNIYASVFRGKEADMAFEDRVMREVDARTGPDAKVFDGVGRALRRDPAHRYWFLPALVPVLEQAGRIAPYTAEVMAADPPAAVLADYRVFTYLRTHRDLAKFVVRHYMPAYRGLWIPAMSGIGPSEWVAPVSGTFRVYASPALAKHVWFRQPLEVGTLESNVAPLRIDDAARIGPSASLRAGSAPLSLTIDGVPVDSTRPFTLRRKQRVRVDVAPGIAVFVVSQPLFFAAVPPGVTLDASAPTVTHVPHF